jgi:heme oxygenase
MSAPMMVKDSSFDRLYPQHHHSSPGSMEPISKSPFEPKKPDEKSPEPKVKPSASAVGAETSSSGLEAYLSAAGSRRMSLERGHVQSFAERLYLGTREAHKGEAMKDEFLMTLIKGGFCPQAYTRYLCSLYVIHEALEHAQNKLLAAFKAEGYNFFVFRELWRTGAILEDIKTWFPIPEKEFTARFEEATIDAGKLRNHIHSIARPSAIAHAEYMTKIADSDPILLIGHMYSFYGTLLSGGQLSKQGVGKSYLTYDEEAAGTSKGIALFTFSGSSDVASIKQKWHDSLSQLPKHVPKIEERLPNIVGEAVSAMRATLNFIREMNLKKDC